MESYNIYIVLGLVLGIIIVFVKLYMCLKPQDENTEPNQIVHDNNKMDPPAYSDIFDSDPPAYSDLSIGPSKSA